MNSTIEKSYGHEIQVTTFPSGFGSIIIVVELHGHKMRSEVRVSKKDDELDYLIPAIIRKSTGEDVVGY